MMKGKVIMRLIPQRHPFMMVEEFEERDATTAVTSLTVRPDNYFIIPDGTMSETGLIEHIAQSCSALMGYQALKDHPDHPPVGIIGEVKRFEVKRRVMKGETVTTTVHFGFTFGNVVMATGESYVGEELLAQAQLKIFVQ